jgi:hypothetical protein
MCGYNNKNFYGSIKMTEFEKLQTAKLYMNKLADGIDPVSGTEVPGDSIINSVELSRCFNYVFSMLSMLESHGGSAKDLAERPDPFSIDEKTASQVRLSTNPVGAAALAKMINSVLPLGIKGISAVQIGNWCESKGYLECILINGRRNRVATAQGTAFGIMSESKFRADGIPYKKNLYSFDAQRMILKYANEISLA